MIIAVEEILEKYYMIKGIEIGEEKGKQKEKERVRQKNIKTTCKLLSKKFSELDSDFKDKLSNCNNEKLQEIIVSIFDIERLDEIEF